MNDDMEPDPDDLEEMAAVTQAATVDASGGAAQTAPKKKSMQREAMMQDWEQAREEAVGELAPEGKVSPQLIGRLKTLRKALVEEEGPISQMLGFLLLKRGDKADKADGEMMLRRAIKLCRKGDSSCRGAHQALAQSLTREPLAGSDSNVIGEAIKLYNKGAALMPDDYETYYQLGRMYNMQPKIKVGGKADKAAAAFRVAAKLRPDAVEAQQMLALRLAKVCTLPCGRACSRRRPLRADN